VLSHDWGGYASFLLAIDHPERVERLVVLDMGPPWPPKPHPTAILLPVLVSYQVAIATPGLGMWLHRSGRLVRFLLRLGTGPGFRFSEEELEAYAEPLREPARARASIACYRTFLARELGRSGRRPEQLQVPTTLIMGGAGMINRVTRPESSGALTVEIIPRSGHFLAEEAPDEVLRLSRLMA
jgi:pimeloyl-ACP methyl ester carboxylesterase